MQGGKNRILPKEMRANRFFWPWDSHWLEIWSNHFCPSMGPNGGSVAMDSRGGPLQLLLTLTLNFLARVPKIRPLGQHSAPFRKGQKVNHMYRKFGPFEDFFAKKFGKI